MNKPKKLKYRKLKQLVFHFTVPRFTRNAV